MPTKSYVLIVDDSEVNREALGFLLGHEGYNLRYAANGQEALQQMQQTPPDLVLLDIMMPGLDGFEVCRRVRAIPLLREVPIVIITSLDDQESRIHGLEAGADDFLSRPLNRAELRVRVSTILRLNRYRHLLKERKKFKWVVEHADDAYLLLGRANLLTYANASACRYLGLRAWSEDLAGPDFIESIKARGYQLLPPLAWDNWPHNPYSLPRYLVRPERPDSPPLWLEAQAFEVGEYSGDTEEQHIVRLRDVSAKIEMQQQVWSFQSMISHKLCTPMAMLEILKIIKYRLRDRLDEELLHLLEMGISNAERQSGQIQSILDYTRAFRSGDDSPPQERFDLAQLPQLVKDIERSMNLSPDIRLHLEPDLPPTCRVRLSRQKMDWILRELITNACKFHPQSGPQLDLHAGYSVDSEALACLRLSDDGPGLLAEELNKIWVPYYQFEKKFTGEVKGMGLGLSTIAAMVWGVGGSCHAFNRSPEHGLVTELHLPWWTD